MTTTEAESPKTKRFKSDKPDTTVNANECLTFHLLKYVDGVIAMEEDAHFPPEMSHQLFGEDETISGYDGLEIDIFLTPRFQALIDVKYAARLPEATDLKEPFTLAFPAGFFEEKSGFDAALAAEKKLDPFSLGNTVLSRETEENTRFLVCASQLSTASAEVKALHAHLQPLLYFFVDAASAIDADDPAWELLLAVETSPSGTEILGFCTAYSFYVFPDRKRVRLSQILVLPPHQGRGVGSMLMEAVYKSADAVDAVDITFEDPTEELQRLRDKRDLTRMLALSWLAEEVKARLAPATAAAANEKGKAPTGTSTAASPLAASPELLTRIQRELRMSKQQARRMWETILFATAAALGVKALQAVEDFIAATIRGQVAAAKKDSVDKKVRDTESGFVMCRAPVEAAVPGARPALPNVPVEECTAEQQAEAVENAAIARIEELQRLVMPRQEGDSDEVGSSAAPSEEDE